MSRRLPRFFPVSVDRNDDGEVWEFTDLFGDRALRIWDEFLSLAEKTQNDIPWSDQQLAAVSRKVRQSSAKVRRSIGWMLAKHWLDVSQALANGSPTILRLHNYVKYHPKRGAVQTPSREQTVSPLPSEPSEPSDYKNKKEKNKSPASPKPDLRPPSPEAINTAQLLSDWIEKNVPNRTHPTQRQLLSWAHEADKIYRIDGHNWTEIHELLEWSQQDQFWKANILSMSKLRQKWTQLMAKQKQNGKKPTGGDIFRALAEPLPPRRNNGHD